MSNRKLKDVPLWSLALRLGIVFILIVMFIQLIWEWITSGNLNRIKDSFNNGTWKSYAISRFLLGTVYGLVTAYFLKREASKKR